LYYINLLLGTFLSLGPCSNIELKAVNATDREILESQARYRFECYFNGVTHSGFERTEKDLIGWILG
jgi:hypothetical protein